MNLPTVIPHTTSFVSSSLVLATEYLRKAFPDDDRIMPYGHRTAVNRFDPVTSLYADDVDLSSIYTDATKFSDVINGIRDVINYNLYIGASSQSAYYAKIAFNYVINIATYDHCYDELQTLNSFYYSNYNSWTSYFNSNTSASTLPYKPVDTNLTDVPSSLFYNYTIYNDVPDGKFEPTYQDYLKLVGDYTKSMEYFASLSNLTIIWVNSSISSPSPNPTTMTTTIITKPTTATTTITTKPTTLTTTITTKPTITTTTITTKPTTKTTTITTKPATKTTTVTTKKPVTTSKTTLVKSFKHLKFKVPPPVTRAAVRKLDFVKLQPTPPPSPPIPMVPLGPSSRPPSPPPTSSQIKEVYLTAFNAMITNMKSAISVPNTQLTDISLNRGTPFELARIAARVGDTVSRMNPTTSNLVGVGLGAAGIVANGFKLGFSADSLANSQDPVGSSARSSTTASLGDAVGSTIGAVQSFGAAMLSLSGVQVSDQRQSDLLKKVIISTFSVNNDIYDGVYAELNTPAYRAMSLNNKIYTFISKVANHPDYSDYSTDTYGQSIQVAMQKHLLAAKEKINPATTDSDAQIAIEPINQAVKALSEAMDDDSNFDGSSLTVLTDDDLMSHVSSPFAGLAPTIQYDDGANAFTEQTAVKTSLRGSDVGFDDRLIKAYEKAVFKLSALHKIKVFFDKHRPFFIETAQKIKILDATDSTPDSITDAGALKLLTYDPIVTLGFLRSGSNGLQRQRLTDIKRLMISILQTVDKNGSLPDDLEGVDFKLTYISDGINNYLETVADSTIKDNNNNISPISKTYGNISTRTKTGNRKALRIARILRKPSNIRL